MPPGLTIRKLADRSVGERVERFHPITGQKVLVDPASEAARELEEAAVALAALTLAAHEPWPLAGIAIVGEVPDTCRVSTTFVDAAVAEGWMAREGERVVHRPGGPASKPWAVTHTFTHADALVIDTVDGPVRYRVVAQPDKYHDGPEGTDAIGDPTARVNHFFVLEREG